MSARAVCPCGWSRTFASRQRAEAAAGRHVCKTDAGVRRATRRYRCARCGLEAVYENAGAKEARYWFNRHSCRKREEAMLRATQHEQRMSLVDRTPKPCHHKQANHQHGTNACYVLDKCRCEPCAQAHTEQTRWRARQKAYGRYTRYINAELVREHITELRAAGMGLKTIAKRSGVSNGALTKIVYGTYAPSAGPHKGRHGNGRLLRGPARRVTRETAERIFALDPAWNGPLVLADGANVDGTDTRLRLRALVTLGYSIASLGRRLDIDNIHNLVHGTANGRPGDAKVFRSTADKVRALYDDLSMQLPPQTNQRERITASRARNYAQRRGWLPPMALDGHLNDEPGHDPVSRHNGDVEPQWRKDSRGIWRAS